MSLETRPNSISELDSIPEKDKLDLLKAYTEIRCAPDMTSTKAGGGYKLVKYEKRIYIINSLIEGYYVFNHRLLDKLLNDCGVSQDDRDRYYF